MELQRVGHNWATFTFFLKLLCYTFVFIQFIFFKLIFLVTSCLPHILFRFLFTFKTFENFLNTFLLLTCCSLTKLCPTLCDPMDYSQATLFFALSWSFLKFMSIELVMPSSHLILCFCFLLLPSSFPSIRVFFSESALCIRWPKYWSFSFSISPSNDYLFRTDFLYGGLVWSPCCPRDFQESSPALQFKSINSLGLTLLYGPTLTVLCDYWKNHSFNYIDLCRQSDVSAS